MRAFVSFHIGDYKKAIDDINNSLKFITDKSTIASCLTYRGLSKGKLGNSEDAFEDCDEALQLKASPIHDKQAQICKGLIKIYSGKTDDGCQILSKFDNENLFGGFEVESQQVFMDNCWEGNNSANEEAKPEIEFESVPSTTVSSTKNKKIIKAPNRQADEACEVWILQQTIKENWYKPLGIQPPNTSDEAVRYYYDTRGKLLDWGWFFAWDDTIYNPDDNCYYSSGLITIKHPRLMGGIDFDPFVYFLCKIEMNGSNEESIGNVNDEWTVRFVQLWSSFQALYQIGYPGTYLIERTNEKMDAKEETIVKDNESTEGKEQTQKNVKYDVEDVVKRYLSALSNGDLKKLILLYDEEVNYYQEGIVDKDFILQDKKYFYNRWPIAKYTLVNYESILSKNNSDLIEAKFITDYLVENTSTGKKAKGVAENILVLKKENGELKIVEENQFIIKRDKYDSEKTESIIKSPDTEVSASEKVYNEEFETAVQKYIDEFNNPDPATPDFWKNSCKFSRIPEHVRGHADIISKAKEEACKRVGYLSD